MTQTMSCDAMPRCAAFVQSRWFVPLCLLLVAVGAVAWMRPLVTRPLLADEVAFAELARSFRAGIPPAQFDQPPLYLDVLGVTSTLFHWQGEQLRWIGVGCFWLQLILIYQMARSLHPRAGLLAAVLWVTHPMAMQGALILDIDNTVLAVCLSAWCLLLLRLPWPLRLRDSVALGLCWCLCLWAKGATPLMLPVALIGAGLTQGRWRVGLAAAWWTTVWGLLLFGAGMALYAWWNPVWPGQTILAKNGTQLLRALQVTCAAPVRELAIRLPRLLLWLNPVALILAVVIWRRWRTEDIMSARPQVHGLWWYVLLLGIGYWVVRGTHFGFAKYHYPMLPVLVALVSAGCVAAGFPTTRRHWLALIGGSLVVGLAYRSLVGDLFLVMGHLRTSFLAAPGETQALLRELAVRLVGAGMLALVVWGIVCWWMRGAPRTVQVLASLRMVLLGMHGATNVSQRTINHSTTYAYGLKFHEMRAVIARVSAAERARPASLWLGPGDVLHYADARQYPSTANYWESAARCERALQDARVAGVIVSPFANTHGTYTRVLRDPAVRHLLETQFVRDDIGDYTVWLRNAP